MVSTTFRRNPRRIKQFVNDLEVRLRFIAEREEAKRIVPPISDNVLAVARVAVIHDEWPETFKTISDDGRRLASWDEAIARGERPEDLEEDDAHSFIRRTSAIGIRNTTPYVRFKQRDAEVRLPRYADFVDGLRAREIDVVTQILQEAAEHERSSYLAEAETVLQQDIEQGQFAVSPRDRRNVIRV